MKKLIVLFSLLLAVCSGSMAETKKLNQGFLKKATKQVWGMELPQFDPKKELTDSIFQGASAANIAVYYYFSADRHIINNLRDGRIPPKEWRLGETEVIFLRRHMVKILDEKGLEENSLFTFEPSGTQRINQILVMDDNHAFGARIFKPDGSVVEVDMKQTITEGDGKKGKDAVTHKIAIPGLEVGDVLDYFRYDESYFLGNSSCSAIWSVMSEYPTASFVVEAKLDPSLSIVVNGFNGIQPPSRFNDKEGDVCLVWNSDNLPALKVPSFVSTSRQLPTMFIQIADNLSQMYDFNKSRRSPGVFYNPTAQSALPGVAEYFTKLEWDGADMSKAADLVKNYRAANPDANVYEIADAVYYATHYVAYISEGMYSPWEMTAFMKDLLDKQNVDTISYLAVSNPRSTFDIAYLTKTSMASPLLVFGDKYYFFTSNATLAPGEIPPGFCGETLFKLHGKRKELFENFFFTMDKLPKESTASNGAIFDVNITIDDPDETSVSLNYDASRKGYFKDLAKEIVEVPDLIDFTEKKLKTTDLVLKKIKIESLKANRYDVTKLKDDQKQKLQEVYKADLGVELMEIDTMIINDFGFDSASPEFKYHIAGKVDDIVIMAGDDRILNIGKLAKIVSMGSKERSEKDRKISIFTAGPSNIRVNVTIAVPEGYTVDKDALQLLTKQTAKRSGVFSSQVNYDEEKQQINLTLLMRNPSTIYPPSSWDEFRNVREEAASFEEASIVFHKK